MTGPRVELAIVVPLVVLVVSALGGLTTTTTDRPPALADYRRAPVVSRSTGRVDVFV